MKKYLPIKIFSIKYNETRLSDLLKEEAMNDK